ncbi:putative replication protein [Acinetobacter baumannii]|nr:putative replication protein [Acinetobacter baumannii]
MTRHVEPKNKDTDNDDEEEVATTDGGGGSRRGLAQAVGRGREDCTEGSHGEPHRPQYKRKKQRWQVSPYVKVRVKNRIRRWDGYLYVIHI